MRIYYNPKLKQLARNLRNNSTYAEVQLWNEIKAKKLGYQFLRQKPIGEYIVDFFCPKLKLVIEVDGESHGFDSVQNRDDLKSKYLDSLGLHIIRYDDSEVVGHISKVVDDLIGWIAETEKDSNTTP